jgi:hypothetical protein
MDTMTPSFQRHPYYMRFRQLTYSEPNLLKICGPFNKTTGLCLLLKGITDKISFLIILRLFVTLLKTLVKDEAVVNIKYFQKPKKSPFYNRTVFSSAFV